MMSSRRLALVRRPDHGVRCVKLAQSIVALAVISLLLAGEAQACGCVGSPGSPNVAGFDAVARKATLLVAGRVVASPSLRSSPRAAESSASSIDIELLAVFRGGEIRGTVRIWDQYARTSCSLDLQKLKVGTLLLIALHPEAERLNEWWQLLGIDPKPDDYLFGTCAEQWRTFATRSELDRYLERSKLSG